MWQLDMLYMNISYVCQLFSVSSLSYVQRR